MENPKLKKRGRGGNSKQNVKLSGPPGCGGAGQPGTGQEATRRAFSGRSAAECRASGASGGRGRRRKLRASRAATPAPRRPIPLPLRARRSVPSPVRSCGRQRRLESRSRAVPSPAVPRSRVPRLADAAPGGPRGAAGDCPRAAPSSSG